MAHFWLYTNLVVLAIAITASGLEYKEKWGYIAVKPKAEMFWWLYSQPDQSNRPLVLWLQGGPGGSSAGFGNFAEIGPLDVNMKPRNTTWVRIADVLFVDQPVGTGFSYVTDESALTTNVDEIADDLVSFFEIWLGQYTRYRNRTFHVFCESYGGKMTVVFAKHLHQAIESGKIKLNFVGIELGDSWISPIDYVQSWGPYLYAQSFVGDRGAKIIADSSSRCEKMVQQGQWLEATACYQEVQFAVSQESFGVSWYNVLEQYRNNNGEVSKSIRRRDPYNFMNSADVFQSQRGDFMKPVIDTVDWLLANTNLSITVCSGQLDLICDVLGTEKWISRLKWKDLSRFMDTDRVQVLDMEGNPAGFTKSYGKFHFYWIINAGHMLPTDNPSGVLSMFRSILRAV